MAALDRPRADDTSVGSAEGGERTIEIEIRDNAFSPDRVSVETGETVRFVFHNNGEVVHDAFIGDEDAQDGHEMGMRANAEDGMGHGHEGDGAGGITVEPGDVGELAHTFRSRGTTLIGCHQPGHYAAAMKMTMQVS